VTERIRFLSEDVSYFRDIERNIGAFTERTGIEVDVGFRFLTELWDETTRAFREAAWDVVTVDEMILAMFVREGLVRPLDDLVARDRYDASDYLSNSIELARFEGSLYGIPYANMHNVLGYRRDLLDRFGVVVPETMEELVDAALRVQSQLRAAGDETTYGFVSRGRGGHGFNVWILASTFFPAWGGYWFDERGRPAFASEACVEALETYVRLMREAGPPHASTLLWTEAHDFFEAGGSAFFIDAATELTLMGDARGPHADAIGAAPVPLGPRGTRHTGLYSPVFAIPARSEQAEAGWQLIQFATSAEQIRSDALNGGNAEIARMSVIHSDEYAQRFTPEVAEVVRRTRELARNERPRVERWFEIGDTVGEAIQQAIAGGDTRRLLAEAEQRVTAFTPGGVAWLAGRQP
jgi:ABC-type glycerol-3-phosphate transport system substrate-binding protein